MLADLDRPGALALAARGGRGGRGNTKFATATRQAPRAGELGDPGESVRSHLELRLIADIGLVGLPNSGKSTLLAALTGAQPKIAAYPFTTLHPNLGVAELDGGHTLVLADVPGLIEGASHGAGLGLEFLRHLERTRTLIHVVDASDGVEAARAALTTVRGELGAYSPELAARPSVLAFNKVDLSAAAAAAPMLAAEFPGSFRISAERGDGCRELLLAAAELAGRGGATRRSRRRRDCIGSTVRGRGEWSATTWCARATGSGSPASSWSVWSAASTSTTTRPWPGCSAS